VVGKKPKLIKFSEFTDYRGSLFHNNDLDLSEVKRTYSVVNPKNYTVRAWHGHQIEEKLVLVEKGIFDIFLISFDDVKQNNNTKSVIKFTLKPNSSALYIPKGFYNGSINIEKNSSIRYFSSTNIEISKQDDFRILPKDIDVWKSYNVSIFEK
tara:strand:- start:35131 stop:35589 length:459 start_codon:yes stop_codon:yes gene_type:complete